MRGFVKANRPKRNTAGRRLLRVCLSLFLVLSFAFPSTAMMALAVQVDYNTDAKVEAKLPVEPLYEDGEIPHKDVGSEAYLTGSFPPVREQGKQGSCVAWAVAYALKSYQENQDHENDPKYPDWDINLPKYQFSPSYVYNQLNINEEGTCVNKGISIPAAMNFIVNHGVCTLDSFSYDAKDYTTQPDQDADEEAARYKAGDWGKIYGIDEIKQYIADGEGVIIGVNNYDDFKDRSPSNPIFDTKDKRADGQHAVCLVGYNDHYKLPDGSTTGAFKFINSHGTNYKDNGYGWITYELVADNEVNHHIDKDSLDKDHIGQAAGYVMFDIMTSAPCAVTYNANGGVGTIEPQEGHKNEVFTVTAEKPARFGYNFLGWSTDPASKTPAYEPGTKLRFGNDATLYAVWEEARSLTLDKAVSGNVEPGENAYYQFTPAASGLYQISISGANGAAGPSGNWYLTDGREQNSIGAVGDNTSFSAGSWLSAGKSYYVRVNFPGALQASPFNLQVTEAAVSDTVDAGIYKIGYINSDSYCLDAVSYGLENATEVQLFDYNNQSNQNWDIQETEDGYYTLSPVYNPAQCLTFAPNSKVVLNARDGSDAQKWSVKTYRGYCKLIPKSDTGSMMAVATRTRPSIEERVCAIDDFDISGYQGGFLWSIQSVNNTPDTEVELAPGTYRIQNLNSDMYLHGWYNASDGSAGMYQDSEADGENQTWIVRDAGEGYRYLSSACNPDLYITYLSDIGRCSLTPRSGADNQKWKVLEGADGYSRFLLKSAPGHVMVVQYASTAQYESIIIYGDNGSSNGKWIITPENPKAAVADGVYEIQNVNSGLYFDACNFETSDGTRVLQWSYNGGFNQRFRVKHTGNGFYTLSPVYAPNMYLAAFANGTVKLTTNGVSDVSLWRILQNPDGSYRFSPKSDLDQAAVVQYASTEVGAELILYDDNGSTNGWWNLQPVLSTTERPTLENTMYSIQNQRSGLSICYDLNAEKTLNQGQGDFAFWGSLAKDGYYTFQQYKYENYISVDSDGRTIITDSQTDEDARLWKVMDDGRIYSKKYPNKVLAVANDSMERGAKLILVDAGSTQSEQWTFIGA